MIAAGGSHYSSSSGLSQKNPAFDRETKLKMTQMYGSKPTQPMSLKHFAEFGAERLSILKCLEKFDNSSSITASGGTAGPRGESPEAALEV